MKNELHVSVGFDSRTQSPDINAVKSPVYVISCSAVRSIIMGVYNGSTILRTGLINKLMPDVPLIRIPHTVGRDILRLNAEDQKEICINFMTLASYQNGGAYSFTLGGKNGNELELETIFPGQINSIDHDLIRALEQQL